MPVIDVRESRHWHRAGNRQKRLRHHKWHASLSLQDVCDLRATCMQDRNTAPGNLSPMRRKMLLSGSIAFGRTIGTGAVLPLLPAPQEESQEYQRMKALISAFALLAFVGASTVPYAAQAQNSTSSAPSTTAKKAPAKKSTAKKTSKQKNPKPSSTSSAPKTM